MGPWYSQPHPVRHLKWHITGRFNPPPPHLPPAWAGFKPLQKFTLVCIYPDVANLF